MTNQNDYKVFQFPELDSESRLKGTIYNVNKVVVGLLTLVLIFYLINSFVILDTDLDNGFYRLLLLYVTQILCITVFRDLHYKKLAFINIGIYYLCFFIYPFLNISRRFEENIYMPLVLLIFAIVLPILFYSTKKDKKLIIFWVTITFLTLIINLVYQYGIATEEQLKFFIIFSDHPMTIVGFLGAIAFLAILFYNYRKYNAEQHELIRNLNAELNEKLLEVFEKNNDKETQNEELKSIQEELLAINEELERKVELRSKELKLKQRKIVHYGFMNSHVLRAPIARIKGLMSIIEVLVEKNEKKQILTLIKESVDDLNTSSQSINEIVNEENEIYLKEMEEKVQQLYGEH